MCLTTPLGYALQPVVILMGGAASSLGQQSQTLSFDNTVFNYHPNHSSALVPLVGGFVGAEYAYNPLWTWQFGLAFYRTGDSSVNGEETQAPMLSLDAINTWNYHYKISSTQLFFENKLFFNGQQRYHPYVLIGLGEGFNRAFDFQVTPQNSGEVATATFGSNTANDFIYMVGLGLDIDVVKQLRLGLGYRYVYLGKTEFGNGILDTGAGGNVFSLPGLQFNGSYNQEVLAQLTYLI